MRGPLRAGVFVGLCTLVLVAGGVVAPAAAGDGIAEFEFENSVVEAEPGETIELELVVDSDGGYADGVGTLGATIAVDPAVATITDVDHGPWLEDGENVSINRTATVSGGRATVRHERLGGPDDDGVTGRERFVTVTVEIAEDAPPSDVEIGIVEADADLPRGFGLRTIQQAGTIVVDGGGETIEPDAGSGAESDDGLDVTTAEEVGRERTNESTADTGADSDSGPSNRIPGFTTGVGVLALLVATAALAARYRSRVR